MIYNQFLDKNVSRLGFGLMRLPMNADGSINEPLTHEMVHYAMEHGVNYYDTAYPYHDGKSETVIRDALKDYPRDSYLLADKYPGHQIADTYIPSEIFEDQLEKCGVDYFDFYLLHNIYEKSVDVYTDPQWGIIDYFIEQKKLGRIRHLGFSTHALLPTLRDFLEHYGKDMEFCQIQLNYLDWTLQDAKAKVELLKEYNIPIVVMEPLRGGKLANIPEEAALKMHTLRENESTAAWAFRFLQDIPEVKVVLSGMSDMAQMIDNVNTYKEHKPLSPEELNTLLEVAESLKDQVPCTGCRYCCKGCSQELNIPHLMTLYNEARTAANFNLGMLLESMPADKHPSACIACGACTQICPQNIDIPGAMKHFCEILSTLPSWEKVCEERAEAARRNKEEKLRKKNQG